MALSFIFSSSATLLGVIVTEGALQRLGEPGRGQRPVSFWLLGVAALLPGWGIALLALIVAGMAK